MKRTDAIALMEQQIAQLEAMPPEYDDVMDFDPMLGIHARPIGKDRPTADHPAVQHYIQAMGCDEQKAYPADDRGDAFVASVHRFDFISRVAIHYAASPASTVRVLTSPRDLVESL